MSARKAAPVPRLDEAWREVRELLDGLAAPRAGGVGQENGLASQRYVARVLTSFLEGFSSSIGDLVARDGAGALPSLGDPQALAHRMTAALPRRHPLDESGPFYRVSDVAAWLGESRQSVHKKIGRHTLLAAQDAEGGSCLPAWQFRDDATVVPHLSDVVHLLARGTDNPWTWIQWLAVPGPAGAAPAWKILDGEDPAQVGRVLQEAKGDSARWAA